MSVQLILISPSLHCSGDIQQICKFFLALQTEAVRGHHSNTFTHSHTHTHTELNGQKPDNFQSQSTNTHAVNTLHLSRSNKLTAALPPKSTKTLPTIFAGAFVHFFGPIETNCPHTHTCQCTHSVWGGVNSRVLSPFFWLRMCVCLWRADTNTTRRGSGADCNSKSLGWPKTPPPTAAAAAAWPQWRVLRVKRTPQSPCAAVAWPWRLLHPLGGGSSRVDGWRCLTQTMRMSFDSRIVSSSPPPHPTPHPTPPPNISRHAICSDGRFHFDTSHFAFHFVERVSCRMHYLAILIVWWPRGCLICIWALYFRSDCFFIRDYVAVKTIVICIRLHMDDVPIDPIFVSLICITTDVGVFRKKKFITKFAYCLNISH